MLHPNSLFDQYKEKIRALEEIDKNSVQMDQFSLYQDSKVQIYYAPHNEYINEKAKILIVGITPGWSQTRRAYQTAKARLQLHYTDEQICFECKMNSRFAGSMRKNLIDMLDELKLQEQLHLSTCGELFSESNDLLHTTSLIKYPCFYKGKNYSGHTPAIGSVQILKSFVRGEFREELRCMHDVKLIIPLGTAVENIFEEELGQTAIQNCEILWGFPHPSGLNAHRKEQFERNRDSMLQVLKRCEFD